MRSDDSLLRAPTRPGDACFRGTRGACTKGAPAMTIDNSSRAATPLFPEFFSGGIEVRAPPWPFSSTEQATCEITRQLSAIGRLTPLEYRVLASKVVAKSIVSENNSVLVDFWKAVNLIYSIINEVGGYEMTEEPVRVPGDTELSFALRVAEFRIASGKTTLVTASEAKEEFLREIDSYAEEAKAIIEHGPR